MTWIYSILTMVEIFKTTHFKRKNVHNGCKKKWFVKPFWFIILFQNMPLKKTFYVLLHIIYSSRIGNYMWQGKQLLQHTFPTWKQNSQEIIFVRNEEYGMYKTSAWKANSTAEYSSKTDNSGNYEYDKKFRRKRISIQN